MVLPVVLSTPHFLAGRCWSDVPSPADGVRQTEGAGGTVEFVGELDASLHGSIVYVDTGAGVG